jgi:hypothetical protein
VFHFDSGPFIFQQYIPEIFKRYSSSHLEMPDQRKNAAGYGSVPERDLPVTRFIWN